MEEGFGPDPEGQRGGEDLGQQFPGGLERSLGPAALLRLEGVHGDRQLGRGRDLGHEHETPSPQLGAVGEIEVLGQRVALPAPGILDRRAPPDSGGPVEVEETPRDVATAVLGNEVAIEKNGLDIGQERIVAVQMLPARLDEAGPFVAEQIRQGFPQEPGARHEVRVEDRDEGRIGGVEPDLERAGLETPAVGSVDTTNIEPGSRTFLHHPVGDPAGVVR